MYARSLLERFYLHSEQRAKGLSHGERIKALLLLALARRPRLLVLDEPMSGLDPVARHELLSELTEALRDERRSMIFSSHNTADVEQISDQITFIDRRRIVESRDKESFLDSWRRLTLEIPEGASVPTIPGTIETSIGERMAAVTTSAYTREIQAAFTRAGLAVRDVQRMTLEEIFVASVMHSRKEPRQ
jgi:ABC-2 type transport system ATP-binding protein